MRSKPPPRPVSSVQSVQRALDILSGIADTESDVSLTWITARVGLPLATTHRLLAALSREGFVRQLPSRRYALGPRLIRLGDQAEKMLTEWAKPHLTALVAGTGENANLALLDGDMVSYVAHVPSPHVMRMFTEVGRQVRPHCTGVGKAILSRLPDDQVLGILSRAGMPAQTEHTIVTPERFLEELADIRRKGYALDRGEQEVGVSCIAVPVVHGSTIFGMSVSGPAARLTPKVVRSTIVLLRETAESFRADVA
jgi:IclR family acetate operon transcriptional repressor